METTKIFWRIESFPKKKKRKSLNFDLIVQRKNGLWTPQQRAKYIHSILCHYPLLPLTAYYDGKTYHFIDGQQRANTLLDLLSNRFVLPENTQHVGNIDLSGLKFTEWPADLQKQLLSFKIELNKMVSATSFELEEAFYRLNNGAPLKQIETIRALLGSLMLKRIQHITQTPFFATKINLSTSSKRRYMDQELVLQTLALIHSPETGFSSREIAAMIPVLKNVKLEEPALNKIENACTYLDQAFLHKESCLKKNHIPLLISLVIDLQEKSIPISPEVFGAWAKEFLSAPPAEYTEACQSGSAKKENVQKRKTLVFEAFQNMVLEGSAKILKESPEIISVSSSSQQDLIQQILAKLKFNVPKEEGQTLSEESTAKTNRNRRKKNLA